VDLRSGTVDSRIRRAIRIEARGSKPGQAKWRIRRVEMITPTEPSVSARTCRKILLVRIDCLGISLGSGGGEGRNPCILELWSWECPACL